MIRNNGGDDESGNISLDNLQIDDNIMKSLEGHLGVLLKDEESTYLHNDNI